MSGFNDITMDDINSATGDQVVEPVQPEPVPEAIEAPAAEATPAEVPTAHPWDSDLGFIPDEALRAEVSKYLGEKWQPRMTQFEQDLKEWQDSFGGSTDHRDLGAGIVAAFQEDPKKAFAQLGVELGYLDPKDFEDDWAEYAEMFGSQIADAVAEASQDDNRLTAEEKRILEWASSQMAAQEEKTQQQTLHEYYYEQAEEYGFKKDEFDIETFDIMFGGTKGDIPKAMALYKATKAAEAPAPAPTPSPAPPVLDDQGGQAPPEVEEILTFQEAGAAFLAEERAKQGR